jgi:hypothetical protein
MRYVGMIHGLQDPQTNHSDLRPVGNIAPFEAKETERNRKKRLVRREDLRLRLSRMKPLRHRGILTVQRLYDFRISSSFGSFKPPMSPPETRTKLVTCKSAQSPEGACGVS